MKGRRGLPREHKIRWQCRGCGATLECPRQRKQVTRCLCGHVYTSGYGLVEGWYVLYVGKVKDGY